VSPLPALAWIAPQERGGGEASGGTANDGEHVVDPGTAQRRAWVDTGLAMLRVVVGSGRGGAPTARLQGEDRRASGKSFAFAGLDSVAVCLRASEESAVGGVHPAADVDNCEDQQATRTGRANASCGRKDKHVYV
jgi:hypothetical protein